MDVGIWEEEMPYGYKDFFIFLHVRHVREEKEEEEQTRRSNKKE
jgi:hypothetical protein